MIRATLHVTDAIFATVGTVCIDLNGVRTGQPVGNKCEGRFHIRLGGAAVNAARLGVVNGVPTFIFGAQQQGAWAGLARELAGAEGLQLTLHERPADGPTLSVINSGEILCQRMRPLCVTELPTELTEALGTVRALLVGPLPPCPDSFELLHHLAALAPQAYRALIAHPRMLGCAEFAAAAAKFNYLQLNFDESKLLPGASDDVVRNAQQLVSLLHEATDVAVTNGGKPGLLFAGGRWVPITPLPVTKVLNETGAGDSFAAAWTLGRTVFGTSIDGALSYSLEVAANIVGERRLVPFDARGEPGVAA